MPFTDDYEVIRLKYIRLSVTKGGKVGGHCAFHGVALPGLSQKPFPKGLVHFFAVHPFEGVDPNKPFDHVPCPV